MPKLRSYKDCLAAAGRRPVPAYDKLRTTKLPGHLELTAGRVHRHAT